MIFLYNHQNYLLYLCIARYDMQSRLYIVPAQELVG